MAHWRWFLVAMVAWSFGMTEFLVHAILSRPPEQCGTAGCTLNNAYGLWNDRTPCKAAKVVYPSTEGEIVAAVAAAAQANQKVKVSTTYGHSIPKVACPGSDTGVIISSRNYTRIVSIDKENNTVTVESGITVRALLDGIASQGGLAINVAPFFDGVSIGGAIANSVHGSSLWGKGGAVHEYVVAMRIVTPASASQGYAQVREITSNDPDLNAARVHLGVLGVVSTVTLQAEPLFKQVVAMVSGKESEFTGDKLLELANTYQYGEVLWYPGLRQVVYKQANRAPEFSNGDGRNDYIGLQSQAVGTLLLVRNTEEFADIASCRDCKCALAFAQVTAQEALSFGFEKTSNLPGDPNPSIPGLITGFPVTGQQNFMQSAGGCQRDANPLAACTWDPRVLGPVYFDDGAALPLRNAGAFIDDMKTLRDRSKNGSLCDLDLFTGFLFRFSKKTQAYLGTAQEDTVNVDFTWSRARTAAEAARPRLDVDVYQELEQLVFDKYGARPHWGKNRNWVFDGVQQKYPDLQKFLAVKQKFDPQGIFSSEWSDAVLGIAGSPASDAARCALEGNCKCSRNEHCAPGTNHSNCTAGRVYPEARVCR